MKTLIVPLMLVFISNTTFSQNLIPNGDFEILNNYSHNPNTSPTNFFNLYVPNWSNGCPTSWGTQGTPDIFSTQNTDCLTKVPANAWANNLPSRIAGTRNYAGMWGSTEALRCGISQTLTSNTTYTLSFYATGNQGHYNCSLIGGGPMGTNPQIRATLKKSSNPCSGGLVILVSQIINNTSGWQNVTGTFTLTPAQAALGYDRIEFRTDSNLSGPYFFMDDVSLYGPPPVPNFDFVTIGQTYTNVSTPTGDVQLTQVCASPSPTKTPVLINGGATILEYGYGIQIQEFNPGNWTGGTTIYNNWISSTGQVPTTDININNLPGVNMQIGQIYLVTLFVGYPYTYVNKLFRINALPTLNAGLDQNICNGDIASITVNTTNWPIQVYNNINLVGTYSSNPINLSPITNTTYSLKTTTPFGCIAIDNISINVRNCSRASFYFKNPLTTYNINSPYGPMPVSDLCSPYKIDGSASVNETAYHFRIQEFDINNWVFLGQPLFDDWYANGTVGNDINLYDVVQSIGNNFIYNKTYLVGLSVGPDWHSDTKFFKAIDCRKSGVLNSNDLSLIEIETVIYPNPTSGELTISSLAGLKEITVTNILGEIVFNEALNIEQNKKTISLFNSPSGIYFVKVKHLNDEITLEKIIKN